MSRAHIYRQSGPDLSQPFTVVSGAVAVYGTVAFVIPAGGTWPGTAAIPDWLLDTAEPSDAELVPGTVVLKASPTPREIEAGVALLHAQALMSSRLSVRERLDLVALIVDPADVNQETLAALIGSRRGTVNKAL